MSSVVATTDNTYGAVNVLVDWRAAASVTGATDPTGAVTLTRVYVDGTTRTVNGSPAWLSGGQVLFWDDEAPLQTPVSYLAQCAQGAQVVADVYNRSVANGWGNATSGQTYTVSSPNTDYNVNGSVGTIQPNTISADYLAYVNLGSSNFDVVCDVSFSALPASGQLKAGIIGRLADASNYYSVTLNISSAGAMTLSIGKRVAGSGSTLITVNVTGTYVANAVYRVHFRGLSTTLTCNVWPTSSVEPTGWLATANDGSLLSGTNIGVIARNESAVVTQVMSYDNFDGTNLNVVNVSSNTVTITGTGGDIGWLKDPGQPSNDIMLSFGPTVPCASLTGQVAFVAMDDNTYRDASGTFDIINNPRPDTVAQLRKAARSTLTLVSQQLTDILLIEQIFASGRNLLLQLPTKYGWAIGLFGSDYVKCFDVTGGRPPLANMAAPERIWQIPYVLANAPVVVSGRFGSNGVGVGHATWGAMKASGLTWAQLKATGKTVAQLAQGQGY